MTDAVAEGFKKVGFVLLGIGFIALVIFVTMSLWNCLIPDIFHGPTITYWQAFGLLLLGKLLFGWNSHHRGWGQWGRGDWKNKIREKMANMTPEQREKMRNHFRNNCGRGGFGRWGRDGFEGYDNFDNWDDAPAATPEKEKDKDKESL